MRDDIISYSKKVIDEHTFMDDLNMFQEDDRYYNWYYGYSKIKGPYFSDNIPSRLDYDIETSATSGAVTTQYFGEQFQPSLVKKYIFYDIKVYPPESVRENKKVTLHLNLEKISMTSLTGLTGAGWDKTGVEGRYLEGWQRSGTVNFTPPMKEYDHRHVVLNRNIESEDLTNIRLETMPGMKLSWSYTGLGENVTPDSKFSDSEENQLFIW